MPSLDGYSLNEKIDRMRAEIDEEIIELKRNFCDLYDCMEALEKKINKPKTKAKKKCASTKSEK
jgi:hypothetical protein